MEEYEIFYSLRKKKNRTQEEELLLRYRKILTLISEVLVDESKFNIDNKKAINKIREYMEDM